MADGSNTEIHYVEESTNGETPASPVWNLVPHSGFTVGSNQENLSSNNIKNGRYAGAPVKGAINVGGEHPADFVNGQFNDLIQAALCGTWTETVPSTSDIFELTTGDTRRSFSVAEVFSDITTGNDTRLFKGIEVNTFNLQVSTSANVTCSFGLVGQEEVTQTGKGGSDGGVTTGAEYDTFSGSVKEGGSTIGIVTEVSLTLDNGMESKPTIFSGRKSAQPSIGLSTVSGNITVYFETMALYEKALNGTKSSIEFTLSNGVRDYVFELPYVTYSGQPDVSGAGAITLPLSFEATFDDTAGHLLKITHKASA